ncbi:SRPBCC family protein [Roseateles sp.]|uniref:SRPBCC family protein n=1 Tax=Roseateles sp. TaxID=1971397 RepID=UPI0039E7FF6E
MKDLDFSIEIAAPVARVWDCMLDPLAYRDWTSAFCEGSYFEGSWAQGSRMRFLDPEGNGMDAVVEENRPQRRLALKLVGELTEGRPAPGSTLASDPAREIYEFSVAADGGTRLAIHLRGWDDAFADMMAGLWPKALQRLKALAESTH